jgi:hypothetical protein
MNAKVLPAAAGWQWWKSAFGLLRRAPVTLIVSSLLFLVLFYAAIFVGLFVSYMILSVMPILALLLGMLFLLAFVLVTPALFVGLLSIFRGADRGEKASLAVFLQPAREKPLPLAATGILIAAFSWVGHALAVLVTSVDVMDIVQMSVGDTSMFASATGSLGLFLVLSLTISTIAITLYWFSLFLVGWHDTPVLRALRESFTATLKNWAPFLISLLVYIGGAVIASIALTVLVGIVTFILPGWLVAFISLILIVAIFAAFIPLVFAFWYYSYKAVFGEEAVPAEEAPTPEQTGNTSAS